jgi:hypothetical protein
MAEFISVSMVFQSIRFKDKIGSWSPADFLEGMWEDSAAGFAGAQCVQ